jgi:hypothetical protein
VPASSAPALTVWQAKEAALRTIDDAASRGLRSDVALDLRNLVNNLANSQATGALLTAEVQSVYAKIDARVREGSLAHEVGERLRADVAALGRAKAV